MKHPTSRMLHSHWDRLRRERAAPERSEIEPGEIRNLLADSLILEIDVPAGAATVRLAGTRVCALFGRELKGSAFRGVWGRSDADPWRLVETVAVDTVGIVAGLKGSTGQDEGLDLELLLLPLRHCGQTQSRILGALSPHVVPHWLGLRPIIQMETTSLRVLGTAPQPAAMPEAANDSQRRGHLVVHTGGRT